MQQAVPARTPMHVWIIGFLSLLWSGLECLDYLMTRMRNDGYISSANPGVDPKAMLAWVDGFPLYAQIGWGLGVWMGLLGSLLLLMRSRWAVWSFLLSLVGAVLGLGYQIVLAPPMPGAEGTLSKLMPVVIIIVAIALFFYARTLERKGVLR